MNTSRNLRPRADAPFTAEPRPPRSAGSIAPGLCGAAALASHRPINAGETHTIAARRALKLNGAGLDADF